MTEETSPGRGHEQPHTLSCPRCGLEFTPRSPTLAIEYCPRCIVQARIAVRLVER
jgi:NMD protein affecting ribosome stability and mRNA decay